MQSIINSDSILGRKDKTDRASSRGGRNVQSQTRAAPQPVPEEKERARESQVGDIDSQGFGIGLVPSHLHGNPVTAATKKSTKSVPSNQQGTHEGRDQTGHQDTSSSSLGSFREPADAPPPKQEV